MTPAQWAMLAIAIVAGAIIVGALCYAFCRSSGEADDRADATLERMRGGEGGGRLGS